MLTLFGGEVEERQQRVGVLLQGHDGLRILGTLLGGKPRDRFPRLRARAGAHTPAHVTARAAASTRGWRRFGTGACLDASGPGAPSSSSRRSPGSRPSTVIS